MLAEVEQDVMVKSQLHLKCGEVFQGFSAHWQADAISGEVVFNTGMVGYVECLTDPSYRGQILTFTYPLIGNYGVSAPESWESKTIQAAGMIVSELAEYHGRGAGILSLYEWAKRHNLPIMTGVDTRALTKVIRSHGVVAGQIVKAGTKVQSYQDINSQHLVQQVSPTCIETYGDTGPTVIVVDCGMKSNIWRYLCQLPLRLKRVPFDYDYSQESFDGVFISNGPGDPKMCVEAIAVLKQVMTNEVSKPIFGICLGSQLMALAIGAKTYKLPFGHRSQNQPCLEHASGRCYLTSQNHGYAVDGQSLPNDWQVTYTNLNDDTVQGIAHQSLPYSAVQFHPEAAPGPVDTAWIFDEFYQQLTGGAQ